MPTMKKSILVLVLILFSVPAFAGPLSNAATTVEGWFSDTENKCVCPACPALENGVVCPDTPLPDVARPPFEIEAIVDFFGTPATGAPQFSVENFSFRFKHNFSSVLNVYGSYSTATFDKKAYIGSLYDETWQYQTLMIGAGWYVHPIIEIFGGAGKVLAKNSEGSEELGMAIEYGVKAHWPINQLGYKIVTGLLTREVPLADEDVEISRSQAEASATYIFIGVALPIGY